MFCIFVVNYESHFLKKVTPSGKQSRVKGTNSSDVRSWQSPVVKIQSKRGKVVVSPDVVWSQFDVRLALLSPPLSSASWSRHWRIDKDLVSRRNRRWSSQVSALYHNRKIEIYSWQYIHSHTCPIVLGNSISGSSSRAALLLQFELDFSDITLQLSAIKCSLMMSGVWARVSAWPKLDQKCKNCTKSKTKCTS